MRFAKARPCWNAPRLDERPVLPARPIRKWLRDNSMWVTGGYFKNIQECCPGVLQLYEQETK